MDPRPRPDAPDHGKWNTDVQGRRVYRCPLRRDAAPWLTVSVMRSRHQDTLDQGHSKSGHSESSPFVERVCHRDRFIRFLATDYENVVGRLKLVACISAQVTNRPLKEFLLHDLEGRPIPLRIRAQQIAEVRIVLSIKADEYACSSHEGDLRDRRNARYFNNSSSSSAVRSSIAKAANLRRRSEVRPSRGSK